MNDNTTQKPGKSSNTVWHHATINRQDKEQRNSHKVAIIWFTGLSGSGKSTLAHPLEAGLFELGCKPRRSSSIRTSIR